MSRFGPLPDPAAPLGPDEAASAFAAILDGGASDGDIVVALDEDLDLHGRGYFFSVFSGGGGGSVSSVTGCASTEASSEYRSTNASPVGPGPSSWW